MSDRTARRLLLALTWALVVGCLVAWTLLPLRGRAWIVPETLQAFWLAAAVAAIVSWWVTPRPDDPRSLLVAACALATVAPLAMVPVAGVDRSGTRFAAMAMATLAAIPLALELARRAAVPRRVRLLRWGIAVGTVAALVIAWVGGMSWQATFWRYLVLILVLAACGAAAIAGSARVRAGTTPYGRTLEMLWLLAVAVIPMIANMVLLDLIDWGVLVLSVSVAGVVAVVLAAVAIRPLAAEAATADTHRDEVIAASEGERTRLAQALHDGPLGDITLLVQRLDATGDADNAAIARAIATDLRSIGNDLQLPILDDLGAGPALDWLVARVARRAGAEVRLAVSVDGRPPHEVERAVYRIAQEAIVNAVKRGAPPVTVGYRADAGSATLDVDDAGPGWPDGAADAARADGRLGLATMHQRAEAIGALLDLGRSEAGGVHVGLRWRGSSA